MHKSVTALFFTILFSVMLVTPSIITMLDFDCEISLLIDTNEEEEKEGNEGKEGKESSKDLEPKILQEYVTNLSFISSYNSNNLEFYYNSYSSNFLELFSPPPESIL